jgi:Peptide N-acetyl-beta-D-glucosaminyl asparaginase amidase A
MKGLQKCRIAYVFAAFFAVWNTSSLADPVIGSPNVAIADPTIPPPYTTPCTVVLFANQQFADFSTKPFTFTPPADCPGPWQKVVLQADYNVTMGVQFDRTAEIWLGGAIVYFGTTQEPSAVVAPSWHIERDVTDYSALLSESQTGHATLGNIVDTTYTGVIFGSASLLFYPLAPTVTDHPPRPDVVLPISGSADGSTADLSDVAHPLAVTFLDLPTNIERVFLDVYAQSQGNEEFWYFNLPDDIAPIFEDGGNTAFREVEVSIDDQPAGVAPIFPWIYTGGVDPLLWRPTPGVQTLAFEPYRVDLTPFAGLLDDGKSHTIAIDVFNRLDHFSTAANLLLYLDHGTDVVTGSVTTNTLTAAPTVDVDDNVSTVMTPDGTLVSASGTVTVTSNRQFTIAGSLNTSHGVVTTQIQQNIAFSNTQDLSTDDSHYKQNAKQLTTLDSITTRTTGKTVAIIHEQRSYPLTFNFSDGLDDAGNETQASSVDQEFKQQIDANNLGFSIRTAKRDNHIVTSATRHYDPDGNAVALIANGQQDYTYNDGLGACYSREVVTGRDSLTDPSTLKTVTDGVGCPAGTNQLSFFDAFYNYASSIFGATVQLLP